MFGELGLPELLVILGIALLIFGPKRLGNSVRDWATEYVVSAAP